MSDKDSHAHPSLDPDDIGRAGWTILHTTAAAYPHHPTEQQRRHLYNFIMSWSHVYPCSICSYHMRQELRKQPPTVSSKRDASAFICRLHNSVNELLGKDTEDCDPDAVLKKWHPSYPDMDDQPTIEEQIAEVRRAENAQRNQMQTSDRGKFGVGWMTSSQKEAHNEVKGVSTDPNEILKRLKGCQVFCPNKDKTEI